VFQSAVAAMTAMTWAQSGDRRVWIAETPGGELLTVTMASRTSWTPSVIGADGQTWWRGEPCPTRLEAQRAAESQAGSPDRR
jgi:hypothetical protein